MNVPLRVAFLAGLLLLSACAPIFGGTASPSPTSTLAPAVPTGTPSEHTAPVTLEIWVPPQFDPAAETPAAALFAARLAEFGQRHPGVRVTVRVKALEGAGGLVESLAAAAAAAPLALPDLIALPPDGLYTSASGGLIQPLGGWLSVPDDPDWFPFAADFARVNGQVFGLPFAADALMLAYWPVLVETPPPSWAAALELNGPLAFPAAEKDALTTLAFYLARGGQVSDEAGVAILEQEQLRAVLEFYEQASATGLMPAWLTQYDQPGQASQVLSEGRAALAVVWASFLLRNTDDRIAPASLPTHNGQPFTLATGWAWALAGSDSANLALSTELAEFLAAPEFAGPWSRAAGLLPARPSALAADQDPILLVAARCLPAAQLPPDPALLNRLGPALSEAALAVLKRELGADEAAARAADSITP